MYMTAKRFSSLSGFLGCFGSWTADTSSFFFFNDTATTEIYTLSLHDALPISLGAIRMKALGTKSVDDATAWAVSTDRKSTRLNSSHSQISYAVFCLKKKNSCACR